MGRQRILGLLDLLRYPEGICDIFMSAAIIQTCVFKVCEELTSFCFWPCDILVDSKMDEVREKNSSNCCYKWLIKETDLSHPREKGKGGRWFCYKQWRKLLQCSERRGLRVCGSNSREPEGSLHSRSMWWSALTSLLFDTSVLKGGYAIVSHFLKNLL